jgi:hypothetical protein
MRYAGTSLKFGSRPESRLSWGQVLHANLIGSISLEDRLTEWRRSLIFGNRSKS